MDILESKINLKDQTNICFFDEAYLSQNPLTKSNVMNYFMLSDFYDKKSVNQQCIDKEIDFQKNRTKKVGTEFVLESVSRDNDLFVIAKYYRQKESTTLLGYYYIFKGKIFQSPDLYTVVTSNIQSAASNILNIINEINDDSD